MSSLLGYDYLCFFSNCKSCSLCGCTSYVMMSRIMWIIMHLFAVSIRGLYDMHIVREIHLYFCTRKVQKYHFFSFFGANLYQMFYISLIFSMFQLSVMRPPNYTLLMIWLPVILLAFIVGYLKRENLHILYDPKYWAIAAMVCFTRVCVCEVASYSLHVPIYVSLE